MEERIVFSEEEIRDGAVFAGISYLFFLSILTFIYKNDNEFARFHAKQGIVLFSFFVLCLFFSLIPVLGKIFFLLWVVFYPIFALYGMYSAFSGKSVHIPIVSDIAEKLTFL